MASVHVSLPSSGMIGEKAAVDCKLFSDPCRAFWAAPISPNEELSEFWRESRVRKTRSTSEFKVFCLLKADNEFRLWEPPEDLFDFISDEKILFSKHFLLF